jgi:hypothetical protein
MSISSLLIGLYRQTAVRKHLTSTQGPEILSETEREEPAATLERLIETFSVSEFLPRA